MTANFLASWSTALAPVLLLSAAATGIALAAAPCAGPGAPSNTQTKCLTAIAIPIPGGTPLTSFDISFVNPHRGEILFGGSLLKRHRHHRYQKVEVRRDGWSG